MLKNKKVILFIAVILSAIVCVKALIFFENGETILAVIIAAVGIVAIPLFAVATHKLINKKNGSEA